MLSAGVFRVFAAHVPRHGSVALLGSRGPFQHSDAGMTDTPSSPSSTPRQPAKVADAKADRAARQAAALRANLRRRKQQARTRQEMEADNQSAALQTDPANGEPPTCP